MNRDILKLLLAVALDLVDFTIGRITGLGAVVDVVLAVVAYIVWGPAGLIHLWELLDPTDQVDGFVPTMTIIAVSQMGRSRKKRQISDKPAKG